MNRALLIPSILLIFSGCGISTVAPPGGYAVVYGINDYRIFPDLSYTDDDAVGVAAMLEEKGYEVILRNSDGTKEQLALDFAQVAGVIGPYDVFIFYFAGHGGRHLDRYLEYSDPAGNEPAYQDSDDEWIFLAGSITEDSYESWSDTALSDDELGELLKDMPTQKRLVILDACNSGGFINDTQTADALPADYTGEIGYGGLFLEALSLYASPGQEGTDVSSGTAAVMTAAGEREESIEYSTIGHGIFTYFLLQTPAYGDSNRDGSVSLLEAYAYSSKELQTEWNEYANEDYRYFPRVSGVPYDFTLFPAD